jgi:hypothetical protein
LKQSKLLAGFLLTISFVLCASQNNAELVDVKIVNQQSGINVVASTVVAMTPSGFIGLLNETENDCSWIHNCVSVSFEQNNETLSSAASSKNIQRETQKWRTLFKSPWPLNKREMVSYSKYSVSDKGETLIEIIGDDQATAKFKNSVLITNVQAKWIVYPINETHSKLTYMGFADPGGIIPRFLIDNMLKTAAENTFLNIREIAQLKALQNTQTDERYDNISQSQRKNR